MAEGSGSSDRITGTAVTTDSGSGQTSLLSDVCLRMYYEQDFVEMDETEALSGVVRRQSARKYGSTSSHTNHFTNQKFISHTVQPDDTLQGMSDLFIPY